jgi:thiol-disulfide isomerase/thioredoxin
VSDNDVRARPPAPFMGGNPVKTIARLRVGSIVAVAVLATMVVFGNTFVRGMAAGAVVFAVLFFGGFALAVRRKVKAGGKPGLRPPPLPMARWDYGMDAHGLDDTAAPFADFAGSVIVLNFWATWCMPCIREMPALERLQAATSDLGVRFACVTGEGADTVRAFLAKRPLSLPIYVLDGETPECFKTRAIPATFVLDRMGNVALRHMGAAAWDHESVVTFVRALAAAPSSL